MLSCQTKLCSLKVNTKNLNSEVSLGLCQISMMELFAKIANSFWLFTIFAKSFTIDDLQRPKHASATRQASNSFMTEVTMI